MGAPARQCHRNRQSRTPVAKRISGGEEPDPERSDQGSAAGLVSKLIANKFDGSKLRRSIGRPKVDPEAERLVSLRAGTTDCGARPHRMGCQFRYNFGTTSVQLRERKNGFPAPKRHQMNHLDFLIAFFGTRRSVVQIHSPRPFFLVFFRSSNLRRKRRSTSAWLSDLHS